jgi:hypothetical protein
MPTRLHRTFATLALASLLTTGAAAALPESGRVDPDPGGTVAPFAWLDGWLARLQAALPGLASVWEKAGGDMDPDGVLSPPPSGDEGGDMDPNGGTSDLPSGDAGSSMDPNG